MKENIHDQAIPDDVLNQILAKLDEVMTLLKSHAIILTPEQRKELPRLGEKSLEFTEKALQYAKANPALCPDFLKIAEFETDMQDVQRLWTPALKAEQTYRELEDTLIAAGSEAYQSALVFYKYIKILTEQGVAGAEPIYNDLKSRFSGGHKPAAHE